jgi:basic membrane protein A
MKKKLGGILAALLALALTGLAGCTPGDNGTSADEPGDDGFSAVFVVTGQLGDMSFNDSAHRGVLYLRDILGWNVQVIEIGRDQTRWEPTFMDLAEAGAFNLIITSGSNAGETVTELSGEFPDQKFLLFDTEIEPGRYPNVYAISYLQNEGSFLAGVLAALVTTSDMPDANPARRIGFMGGQEHPIISDFLVGYIEGALFIDPEIEVLVSYIGSWDDTARGMETAIALFNQGVDIVYIAAEQAGLGAVEAAKELGGYVIGVDSDMSMLFRGVDELAANVILTSILKNVDASILRAGRMFEEGTLPFGFFESLGIVEDGMGIAINEYYERNVPQSIRDVVEDARVRLMNGEVQVTTALGTDPAIVDAIINSVAPR